MSKYVRRSKDSMKEEESRDQKPFPVRHYFPYICLKVTHPSVFEFARIRLISAYFFTFFFHEGLNRLRTG